jgi:hypothetical protein
MHMLAQQPPQSRQTVPPLTFINLQALGPLKVTSRSYKGLKA